MSEFRLEPTREQEALPSAPYDRWVDPAGDVKAQFHRTRSGFYVRFPEEVDFAIDAETFEVTAWPAPEGSDELAHNLYNNAILPVLGNHCGGLFLHGSAVATPWGGIAFLGTSRSGKTTLAGAFAAAGHPFLTEDVIELEKVGEDYLVQPKQPILRLFRDSAEHFLEDASAWPDNENKRAVAAPMDLPFCDRPTPLRAIFVLAHDEPVSVAVSRLGPKSAFADLMPHSFILDVEDKRRLSAHFSRLAELSQAVPCHALDYRREYGELPQVISAVVHSVAGTD